MQKLIYLSDLLISPKPCSLAETIPQGDSHGILPTCPDIALSLRTFSLFPAHSFQHLSASLFQFIPLVVSPDILSSSPYFTTQFTKSSIVITITLHLFNLPQPLPPLTSTLRPNHPYQTSHKNLHFSARSTLRRRR